MRNVLKCFLLVSALLITVSSLHYGHSVASAKGEDNPDITGFLARFVKAHKAGDMEAIEALYCQSKRVNVVLINAVGNRYRGLECIKERYSVSREEMRVVDMAVRPREVHIEKSFAVCDIQLGVIAEARANSTLYLIRYQGTIVLKREKKGLSIIHMHFSPCNGTPLAEQVDDPEKAKELLRREKGIKAGN